MKKLILIFVLFFIIPVQASGFEVTAQVNKNKISKNDSIILRITLKGGKGEVDTSVIKDFIVESRGSSTNVSIVNGNYSKTTSYAYLLFPRKEGTLTIPEIEVVDGRKITSTEKITITVSEQINDESTSNDFFAKASISDSTLFIGQDAIYTFQLFSAATFFDARLIEPGFQFLSVKKLGKKKNYSQNINGKIYNVNEINFLITPGTTGDFTINPASVTMQIPLKESNNSGFDSFFSPRKTVKTISSNSITIKVTPLPQYTGKSEFTGLIGNFKIKAEINKKELQIGESATLTLTVSGTGNIMDTSIKNIDLPENSFNIYDDQPLKKEELTQNGYVKKKIFKKALVPVKPGDFTIPEIGLIYFDTQSGKYKKTTAAPIEIRVTKSADDKESSLQIPGNNIDEKKIIKHEVEFTGRDILPLKQGADVLKNQKDLSFNVFALLIFSPFIIFCLIKFFTGFTKKERSNSVVMKQKAVEALKNARDTKLSHEDFLNHIRKAVVSSILSKGDITGESLTKEEAYKILQKSSLNNKEIEDILNTLNDIESAKYGGESLETNKRKEFFSKAKQIIKICSIIFCIMSFVSFIPLKAQAAKVDESGTLFLEGVKEYKSGNFETAAQKFEIIALNGIKNGKLYYNTANAFLKAGDVGKAVLWYERAKKLIPSDADLKFNLDYAQERLKDINDSKSLNFSDILFFWKNYFSSNLIRYSAIILSFIVFLYSSIRVINRKKIFTTAGSLAFVLFLLVLSTALFDYYQLYNTNSAIIIPDKVSVRSGLSEDSTELFILHAGTKVKVDKENNEFFRISFSKGKLGWVKKGDAVKI